MCETRGPDVKSPAAWPRVLSVQARTAAEAGIAPAGPSDVVGVATTAFHFGGPGTERQKLVFG